MNPKPLQVDSLTALLGGMGDPTRDKRAGLYYTMGIVDDYQLMSAYSTSWMARKIVNIPARDAVRSWRNWQAEQDQIEKIEATENRLMLRQKIEEARIKARLFGGAAIYIGTADQDISKPFEPEKVGADGIKYLTVMSRVRLQAGELDNDPTSETFDKPKVYRINERDIHPSRLVIFNGLPVVESFYTMGVAQGWGNSILVPVLGAVKDAEATYGNVASLVFEANVDVMGLPDMLDQLNNPEYVSRMQTRMMLAAANKGINRSILMDATETFERKQISFGSLPDVISAMVQAVCGAADIPATRFMGMSPAGMSATGESDLRNYYDGVNSDQTLIITPSMNRLDEALIVSSLGSRPADVWYDWAPLWQISDKEKAEIADKMANVADKLNRTGLISQPALSKSVINQFTEDGIYPGLEAADAEDPVDWEAELEMQQTERQAAIAPPEPAGNFAKDAAPRSLYISRRVLNSKDLIAWAKSQGFDTTLTGIDMHVTVCHSRDPVDWFKVGEPWESELTVKAGGPRLVEQFNGGAIVLMFASREISYRHGHVMALGGSHDYEEFQPHVTISYDKGRLDLSKIEPYQGEIRLGPEIFAEIKGEWK